MRPVSDNAFYIHLNAYENEIVEFFHKNKISSATLSAISILLGDSDPEASGFSETFFEEELIPLNDWVSNNDGLIDYLETRYHEAVADPLEHDDHTYLFYIGNTSECAYKNFEEFKSELDLNMVSNIFKKCWQRSSNNEYPKGRQFLKDFPEFKTDYSKNKKLKGEELIERIAKDILPNYVKIKSYGYISTNKNGDDIALVEEFFLEHTKSLENKKISNIEKNEYRFPSVWRIGKLSKGKYLIGDLGEALRYGNKELFNEFKSFENRTDETNDEYYLSPRNFEEYLIKEKGIDPADDIFKLSPDCQFIMIAPGIDGSSFSDDNGGRFFQNSNCIICLKVSKEFNNKEGNLTCYQFTDDFECSYFMDYDILKLGDLHVYSDY